MKISLNWLKDYIEIDRSAEEVAEVLSDLGLPCEGVEYLDDDVVIDVEVTSNRGDCLGHIGVARELAAATGKELKLPAVQLDELTKEVGEFASVEILSPELCGRYMARVIEGVKVGPSPDWMRKRLEAVGMRSVNNVVDATNYAMMETGQPPHAFDYDRIKDGRIIVRKTKPGEQIVSIDGTKCELRPDVLVIADPKGPVAIAGVMGGLDTEVSESTTMVLLEDAYFDPVSVRTTSRVLALPSEAAFRFERIVDIENIDWASKRTTQLIVRVAGGKVAGGVVDAYPKRPEQKQATLRLSRLHKLLGIEVPGEEVVKILSGLNFEPERNGDSVVCSVPSWRSDVYREADLIEEVARVYGYAKVPAESKISIEVTPVDERQELADLVGRYLNGCGFYETINVSFLDGSLAGLFAQSQDGEHLSVKDVSGKSANLLRQSLLASLLSVIKANHNVGNVPCRVFEICDTYVPVSRSDKLPDERTKLAIACDGDLRMLRGVVEGLIRGIDPDAAILFEGVELPWAEAGAAIKVNGRLVGCEGVVSQSVKAKLDFKDVILCGCELDFEKLLALRAGPVKLKPIPKFPAISRDLSIVVGEDMPWAHIAAAVEQKGSAHLEDLRFVGIYRGKGIPSGRKSVTLSLLFRDSDGTLTHEQVDGYQQEIVSGLAESVGAELRTA